MKKISKAEAMALVQSNKRGWWALHANPPVENKNGHVVQIGEDYYDTSCEEFSLEYKGVVGNETMSAKAHIVSIHCEELQKLVVAEMQQVNKIG